MDQTIELRYYFRYGDWRVLDRSVDGETTLEKLLSIVNSPENKNKDMRIYMNKKEVMALNPICKPD